MAHQCPVGEKDIAWAGVPEGIGKMDDNVMWFWVTCLVLMEK